MLKFNHVRSSCTNARYTCRFNLEKIVSGTVIGKLNFMSIFRRRTLNKLPITINVNAGQRSSIVAQRKKTLNFMKSFDI